MADQAGDKVVLVTGAAQRIGAEIARTLHARGARLVIHHRNSVRQAQALKDELTTLRADSAITCRADLANAAALHEMVEWAADRFGRLDALVNSASAFFRTPLGSIAESDYGQIFDSNIKGPLFLCQAAAPHLRVSNGCIVNIVDIHAERPLRGFPVYCAAKAALVGLTRALAIDLAPDIRVNAVAPGPILWPESQDFPDDERERIVLSTPLQRMGGPTDVAQTVAFLIEHSGYVTGQIIAVDGGRSLWL